MGKTIKFIRDQRYNIVTACAMVVGLCFMTAALIHKTELNTTTDGKRLVTVYDRGDKRVVLTHARSVRDALKEASIATAPEDTVEPGLDNQLLAEQYFVNIYRARPVIVVESNVRQKVMTAAQTASGIVASSGIAKLHDEDKALFASSENIANEGASTILTIDRATPLTLLLYGKPAQIYSHAETVGEMLKQRGVRLSPLDSVSVDQNMAITAGMTVSILRDGVQTATVDELIGFSVRKIIDFDQPLGYRKIQTPGTNGHRSVTYEITALDGVEISRKVIQNVTIDQPKDQVEIVGAKPGPNALTKSKGAQHYTDSRGIVHRETYYDLPMNVVIGACGGGGYTVREDGAKVDKDGYILVAANYGNYPKCSVVETSMGPGKVYDTGGFAVRHPHGFDLATDWSRADGR